MTNEEAAKAEAAANTCARDGCGHPALRHGADGCMMEIAEEVECPCFEFKSAAERICLMSTGQLWEEMEKHRRLAEEARAECERCDLDIVALKMENDRLKHELAEARRRAGDAIAMVRDTCAAHADDCKCEWCAFAFAATPAEQAQPLPSCVVSCTKCSFVSNGLTLDEAAKVDDEHKANHAAAEQAQGEAAPACTCGSGAHPRRCHAHPWTFADHIEELSRETLADDVAELAKRMEKMEAVVKHIDLEHAEMCPQHMGLAPPPIEAARPGHAIPPHPFLGHRADAIRCGISFDCGRTECGMLRAHPVHAVPPIPEGCE